MFVMYSGRSGGSSPFIVSVNAALPGDDGTGGQRYVVDDEIVMVGQMEVFDGLCEAVACGCRRGLALGRRNPTCIFESSATTVTCSRVAKHRHTCQSRQACLRASETAIIHFAMPMPSPTSTREGLIVDLRAAESQNAQHKRWPFLMGS